jgi:soluble lytic murein transglycosylase-like protein
MTLNKIIGIAVILMFLGIVMNIPDIKFNDKKQEYHFNKHLYYYMVIQDKLIVDNVFINARVRNIPESLIFAIIRCESFFDPTAINRKNDNGTVDYSVMQLNSQTFAHLTERELMNVSCNIYNGCGLLEHLYKVYNGNLVKIIMAYNAGERAVDSGHIPKRTINYLNEVLKNKAIYDMEIMKMELRNDKTFN